MTDEPGSKTETDWAKADADLRKAWIETLLVWNKRFTDHYANHPFYARSPECRLAREIYAKRNNISDPDRLCTNGGYPLYGKPQSAFVPGNYYDFLTNSCSPFPAWMSCLKEAKEFYEAATKLGVLNG